MRRRSLRLAGCLALLAAPWFTLGRARAEERFEAAAWVDHFDFAAVRVDGALAFDAETPAGCRRMLDHVLETGATTVLWRNCGGATMRYQSRAESHHQDAPFDKRRLPDNREVYGWLRLGDAEPDILRSVFAQCRELQVVPGVHWPFEENHWSSWTLGGWNLEHPQYWSRNANGLVWAGRSSLAYPEVVEHKLALLDELVERGLEVLFIDTWRAGGWSPADEHVPPVLARWRQEHAGAEPPKDPRDEAWCRLVSTYTTELFRRMRERLDASGRHIRFLVGAFALTADGRGPLLSRGIDWRALVDQGIVDGIVINSVPWEASRPFDSTRELYREVIGAVNGRAAVLCPVRAYDYDGYGMGAYAKATGLAQDEIAAQLTRIAWEEGADGISLECVDYNNYSARTRQSLRTLLQGECRLKRPRP